MRNIRCGILNNHIYMSKDILVYGSLRPGEYNFSRFKQYYEEGIKYVKTIERLKNYELFDLGAYPCVVYNAESNNNITVDVLRVSDACYEMIYSMEIGAGYHVEEVTVTDGGETKTYPIFAMLSASSANKVKSGDWVKFLKNSKNE